MSNLTNSCRRFVRIGAIGAVLALAPSVGGAQPTSRPTNHPAPPGFTVDGEIALNALMSLSDGHLEKIADVLKILANTDVARSCDWQTIREHLADAKKLNVPAVFWFATPDGGYWTVAQGRINATLTDRRYFPKLMAGKNVIGDLVVSHSTSRNTAIVAVPILGQEHEVIGALGASVHLDSLAALLRSEMGGLGDRLLFFAIDSQPLGALNSDPAMIFTSR